MKKLFYTLLAFTALTACQSENTDGTWSERDSDFANKAADAGMFEVKLGELARDKATTEAVRNLADQIVSDHKDANDKLKQIASDKGMTLPQHISAEHQRKYDDMASKNGIEFDKAYADAMVSGHKDVISMFEKEIDHGEDSDLTKFAMNTKPKLEHHLEMAKDAEDRVKEAEDQRDDMEDNMDDRMDNMKENMENM